jgi:hypothetical protein
MMTCDQGLKYIQLLEVTVSFWRFMCIMTCEQDLKDIYLTEQTVMTCTMSMILMRMYVYNDL